MATVTSPHIWFDEKGGARVGRYGHKVRQIVVDYVFNKWSPEVIHESFPDLSLGQIHAALAYYYDNKEAIDEEIKVGEEIVEEAKKEFPPKFTRNELDRRLKQK